MEQTLDHQTQGKNSGCYIVCLHRKNSPRISVEICERNCRFKDRCKEYREFFQSLSRGALPEFIHESRVA